MPVALYRANVRAILQGKPSCIGFSGSPILLYVSCVVLKNYYFFLKGLEGLVLIGNTLSAANNYRANMIVRGEAGT